ncbi:DUF58 domain-containing protein [Chromatium okenii]|uniref:DUF58 domain-containing protein n=1 Tax=Chromatium okenii TaxID=61644 RepID=UPI0026ED5CCD|nr:DUF58 domain-containing protein [Chromatium okenii]
MNNRITSAMQRHFHNWLRRVPIGNDGIARIWARQIYILPTSSGLMFGAVVMLMLLGSLNYQNNLGLLFTFFLVAIGLLAMHHAWFNLLKLAVQVRGGAPVFVGELATIAITVRAEQPRAHYDIRLQHGQHRAAPVHIPRGDQRQITLGIPATRRGLLHVTELMVETRHPLHLFRAWSYLVCDATTLIYPQPAPHAPAPDQDGGAAQRPQRTTRLGADDYLGSRPYRPGDSPRHIDWKAFARERGLVVKQFGGETGQTVWLDWSQLTASDPEIRLSVLTRQVLDASASGVQFGLRLPGVIEQPAAGAAQMQRCLTHLALFHV